MQKGFREYKKMLARIGCQIVGIEHGKHLKVCLMLPSGRKFLNIIPVTPGDQYWVDANRQLIQRAIRENNQQAQSAADHR